MRYVAVLDANVLYDAFLRDLFLRLHINGAYQAKWTDRIHDEWMRSLNKNRVDISSDKIKKLRNLIDAHARDTFVGEKVNYFHLI